MKNKYACIFIGIGIACSSCISEYVPDFVSGGGILVVDGTITNDTSVIRLSWSMAMTENEPITINDADVSVECDDGLRFGMSRHTEAGDYFIPVGSLNTAHQYRLRIVLNEEEYVSEYLSPLITPEIDSISWIKRGQGEPVYICVSTHDVQDQSRYYRWTYKEHWEFKAELLGMAGFYNSFQLNGKYYKYDLSSSRNRYYCWGADSSKVYIVDTSERLSANNISEKKLIEIAPSHDKLSILYYISISQYQIRKEAYDYFFNIQRNNSQTGSLFSPIPSEMKGNVHCASNPRLAVIGYVEVSTRTNKERFLYESEGLFEPPVQSCSKMIYSGQSSDWGKFGIFEFKEDNTLDFETGLVTGAIISNAPLDCLDCTRNGRGSKNKPNFWPTSHL